MPHRQEKPGRDVDGFDIDLGFRLVRFGFPELLKFVAVDLFPEAGPHRDFLHAGSTGRTNKLAHGHDAPFLVGDRPGRHLESDAPGSAVPEISDFARAVPDLHQPLPMHDARAQMKLEPQQPGFGPGHRIGAQRLLGSGDDLFGADGLDPDVKCAGLARRIDARLDQAHIFIEDRVLGRDPECEDAVEPALDRRQFLQKCAVLVGELETGHALEALHVHARELFAMEKMIPLGEGFSRVVAFQIIRRIEQVLATRLALPACQRTQTVETARDGRDEASLALAVGRHRPEHRRHALIGAMGAPQALDRDIGPPARFQQEMDAALVGRPAGQISMIGTTGATGVGEDKDGFQPVHECLGLGEIGACAAPFEFLGTVAADYDAARSAGHLGDLARTEMRKQCVESSRNWRHGAEFLDQRIARGQGFGTFDHIARFITHRL